MSATDVKAVIFVSLLIDLFAFTIPLPLFPRLIDAFIEQEAFLESPTLLSHSLTGLRAFRTRLIPKSLSAFEEGIARKHDVVLLGGAMGSLFSLAQYASAPRIGRAADRYGRRPVLLVSMLGNILSGVIWVFSTNFALYLLSRAVGGISEANVQLALASLADITPPHQRARSMALVGIAFSIAFVAGPLMGAWLASRPMLPLPYVDPGRLNVYALPAIGTVLLLVLETLMLFAFLPETANKEVSGKQPQSQSRKDGSVGRLHQLETLHLHFLFIFSGVEFSLTFLTFDLFGFSNRDQGYLLGGMGLFAALLQGTVVRRGKLTPRQLAATGLATCSISLIALALLPTFRYTRLLRFAAACLATTSATVVTSLTAVASVEASARDQGAVLGSFRSQGQLGRALGPIVAVSLYWSIGPTHVYAVSALGMIALLINSLGDNGILVDEPTSKKQA